jgi:hypothetical protein
MILFVFFVICINERYDVRIETRSIKYVCIEVVCLLQLLAI